MYKWMNIRTGEVAENFWKVLKTEFIDFRYYKVIGIWKYRKEGF